MINNRFNLLDILCLFEVTFEYFKVTNQNSLVIILSQKLDHFFAHQIQVTKII